MKKTFIKMFIVAATITSYAGLNSVNAQETNNDGSRTRLGLALGLGVPTKSGSGDFVIAPDLRLQHDLAGSRTSLTLTTGYYGFVGKPDLSPQSDLIPLKAGAKFFFGDTFYAQPEVGVAFSTKSDYGTPFVWAPSIGYANQKWDIALRYEGFEYESWSNGMVALRAAYSFNLSK